MSKYCPKCKQILSLEMFAFRNRAKNRLTAYCNDCRKPYARERYLATQEHYLTKSRERNRRYRCDVRAYVTAQKNHPCVDCAKYYPTYVMDFDHVRGIKLFDLSRAAAHYSIISFEKIDLEIAKCELVCANCHRERTYQRSLSRMDKTEVYETSSVGPIPTESTKLAA